MERRRVDDGQDFGSGLFGQLRRCFKPRVFTNQKAHAHRISALARLKHTHTVAWHKVTPLVKHLVIG